jgi:hypothetical protein
MFSMDAKRRPMCISEGASQVKKTTSKALAEKIHRLYTEGMSEAPAVDPSSEEKQFIRVGKVVPPKKFRWPELLERRRQYVMKTVLPPKAG